MTTEARVKQIEQELTYYFAMQEADAPPIGVIFESDITIVSIGKGEESVYALCTEESVELRLATVHWRGHAPERGTRLWKRLNRCHVRIFSDEADPFDASGRTASLAEVLADARVARSREFALCSFCGRRTPIERRTHGACHGCASEHLGIIY